MDDQYPNSLALPLFAALLCRQPPQKLNLRGVTVESNKRGVGVGMQGGDSK